MSSSSFPILKGRDALFEYVPNTSYPPITYVEKDLAIYKSNVQTSCAFIPSEWITITREPSSIDLQFVTDNSNITTNDILINGGGLSLDKKIAVYTDDCQFSCVDLIGNAGAGGGVLFVGGDLNNGAGIAYQNNDTLVCGYEHYKASIFRRCNGANVPVMTFSNNSSDVNFTGFIYEQGQPLSDRYLSASSVASDSCRLSGLTSNQFLRSDLDSVDLGSTSASGKTLNIISGDDYIAKLSLYGNDQGTGNVFVGRNSLFGGGVAYHGDNPPVENYCTHATSFYRKNNGVEATVFYYSFDCNNVIFNGFVCAPTYFEGGTPLSTKYLGINAIATDSCKFSGLTCDQFVRSDANTVIDNNISTKWGSGVELKYCGVNTNSYITNCDATGNLNIGYNYLGSTLNSIVAVPNSCVSLYYNNNEKLYTVTSGITVNGCGFATQWINTSDINLKECVTPITNALEKTSKLCGVCYNLINENSKHIGLIAQDTEKILPEVVNEFESTAEIKDLIGLEKIKGISYGEINSLLIEAIKELREEVIELKKDVNLLKGN